MPTIRPRICTLFVVAFCSLTLLPTAKTAAASLKKLVVSSITSHPTKSDWQHFLASPLSQRKALWNSYHQRSIKLAAWTWKWRLAWIHSCQKSWDDWCQTILEQSLIDPALVVRNLGAKLLAQVASHLPKQEALAHYRRVYLHPGNLRHERPLFILQRILAYLEKSGDSDFVALGKELAAKHHQTREYWTKLAAKTDER